MRYLLFAVLFAAACSRGADESVYHDAPTADGSRPSASVPDDARPGADASAPVQVTIEPEEPVTGALLRASIDDPLGGRLHQIAWFIDGQELVGHRERTLPGSNVRKGSTIEAVVTPVLDGVEGPSAGRSVTVINSPPEVQRLDVISSTESRVVFRIHAVDPDGDDLTYRLENEPAGMRLDESRGEIVWDIDLSAPLAETVVFTVIASDGEAEHALDTELATREELAE
jgi:hypothetical protein